jgi:CDP-diacylglycerol--glycerol-3-phosphate 3-phosphatidyltransferase
MNLPNKLTLGRILLVPVLVVCLMTEKVTSQPLIIAVARVLAVLVFLAAALTDMIDGRIARARGLVTNFGKLMDPLADKLLVAAAFISMVDLDVFPAWFVIVVLFREFLVTGLRSLGTARGRVIQANRWGKHKTLWQMLTILLALVFLAARDTLVYMGEWDRSFHGQDLEWWFHNCVMTVLIVLCLFFTILSGTLYVVRNWDLVSEE